MKTRRGGAAERSALRLRAAALVAVTALACGSAPSLEVGDACALNSDCTSPEVCVFARCHTPCTEDRDCAATGQRCVITDGDGNVCQLPDESDCTRTSDCGAGQVCAVDLECRNACLGDRDCTKGQVCVDSACANPSEVGGDGHLPHHGGEDGDACSYDSECVEPRNCRDGTCILPCMTSVDCPFNESCEDGLCVYTEPECVPNQVVACDVGCGRQTCGKPGKWLRTECAPCPGAGGAGGAGGPSGPASSGAGGSGAGNTTGTNTGTNTTATGGGTTTTTLIATTGPGAGTGGSSSAVLTGSTNVTGTGGGTSTATTGSTNVTGTGGGASTATTGSTNVTGTGGGASTGATGSTNTTATGTGGMTMSTAAAGVGGFGAEITVGPTGPSQRGACPCGVGKGGGPHEACCAR